MRPLLVCLAPLLAFALGCDPTKSSSPFQPKLDAAAAIGDPSTRDGALAKVAEDAAAEGDVEIAGRATGRIGDPSRRDNALAAAALRLAAANKADDAKDLAKKIGDPSKRDQTLAKLAKGEFAAPVGK